MENKKQKYFQPKFKAKFGKQPNVVFILSDQHNAKCMGYAGHPDVKTPNFDQLAKEGTRFDACITANPICTPSRVSYHSGQYCNNHGVYGLSGPAPHGVPTVFGYFKMHGYKTAALGKIHCPAYWIENDTDYFHDTCGTSIEGRSKEYTKYLKDRNLEKLEDHGVMREFGRKGAQTCEGRPSKVSFEDGQEGWATKKSIEFMKKCSKENQPFFVHLSLPKPHQCYTPAKRFWDLYDEDKLTLPPSCDYDMEKAQKPPHLIRMSKSWQTGGWTLFEPKTFEAGRLRKLHGYLGNISHVDHAVGMVNDFLKESGLDENTIVIYASDHGDYAAEHNIMEKAPGICSDAITRVPMIWKWPGKIRKGHAVKEVIETVDVTPTLCSLAGMNIMETCDGQNITDLLKGQKGDPERVGVTQFPWSKSIRKGKFRLVEYPKQMFKEEYPDGFGELYDLQKDPYEMKNLYFEKEYREKVTELKKDLYDYMIVKERPVCFHPSQFSKDHCDQAKEIYHHKVNKDNKMNYRRVKEVAENPGWLNYI